MQMRELGKSGIKVTPLAYGGWPCGGGGEWGVKLPDEEYLGAIRAALEGGINFLDSAVFYGHGHSEELIGQAIKGYDREKIVLSTKQVAGRLTHDTARQTVEECMKRLDVDYIDLFLVHWPNPKVDIAENMDELNKLKEEGKIRAIGVSNYTLEHIKRAQQYAQIDMLQPCYSLFWRYQLENEILPYCREQNIGIMTYSSIGQGILTGKFSATGKVFAEGDQRQNIIPLYSDEVFPVAVKAAEKIGEIGAKYGKTPVQTAINWVMATPGITTALVGAKTAAQQQENLGALGWELSAEDYKAIGDIGLDVAKLVADWDTLFEKDHPALKFE
ncbi:MAG: aldo/keto reductase [Ruminococcaceae bacterium]|nr:aldo/keto reductase [Oscillospiraceae bacterium]